MPYPVWSYRRESSRLSTSRRASRDRDVECSVSFARRGGCAHRVARRMVGARRLDTPRRRYRTPCRFCRVARSVGALCARRHVVDHRETADDDVRAKLCPRVVANASSRWCARRRLSRTIRHGTARSKLAVGSRPRVERNVRPASHSAGRALAIAGDARDLRSPIACRRGVIDRIASPERRYSTARLQLITLDRERTDARGS